MGATVFFYARSVAGPPEGGVFSRGTGWPRRRTVMLSRREMPAFSPYWYMRGGPQTAVSGVAGRESARLRAGFSPWGPVKAFVDRGDGGG